MLGHDRRDEVRRAGGAARSNALFLGRPSILSHDAPRLAVRRPSLLPRALRNADACPAPRPACRRRRCAPPARVADLTDVVCPPYDVIDDAERRELLDRHERNAVRLEYSAGPDPYAAAAAALERLARGRNAGAACRAGGLLLPACDGVGTGRADRGGHRRARAARALGRRIRPHEHTMPGPKADRLALARGRRRTQLSPILAVYFDRVASAIATCMSRRMERRMAGARRRWAAPPARGRRAGRSSARLPVGGQTLFIADGHHRYETALAYQAEVRADPAAADAAPGELAADWIMMWW